MDVEGLRKELEEHLKKNPDDSAPSGFRDRFESVLEQMKADDGITDDEWHEQLQRIRNEAEAAAKLACDDGYTPGKEVPAEPAEGGDPPIAEKGLDDGEAARPPASDSGGSTAGAEGQDSAGFLQRFGLPLGIAAIALAAAYFAFRS